MKVLFLFDEKQAIERANYSLAQPIRHITDVKAPLSEGGPHDFYSNGDYWWSNPDTVDGLPYVRRDGETNPNNFFSHRNILREMRTNVSNLAVGYLYTKNEEYVKKAAAILSAFFIEEGTKMNPHLQYAQAIPGICAGRGSGIIDTLHLIEVPMAIKVLKESRVFPQTLYDGLKKWFVAYLHWATNHENGIAEMNKHNNHAVCWVVQVAVFAKFVDDQKIMEFCKERYKKVLLPEQMAHDGSFSAELARTKPYGYSIFMLDNMITICQVLSTAEDSLWNYKLSDGRGIKKGLEFLYPYLEDKSKWPYQQDVHHFAAWPVAFSGLFFAGLALEEAKYLELWNKLERDPTNDEVRRSLAIRSLLLWI